MHRSLYDRIVDRLNEIMENAIRQVSEATSLQMCASIFTNARTTMLKEVFEAKKKVMTGELTEKEYHLLISRCAHSQMYIIDAIKKRMFKLLDEEAIRLTKT